MAIVNIHQAKTHFSQLVDAASRGEEVVIAKAGKPTVKLVPITGNKMQRKFGLLAGQVTMSEDFDDPLPDDIVSGFEGKL